MARCFAAEKGFTVSTCLRTAKGTVTSTWSPVSRNRPAAVW